MASMYSREWHQLPAETKVVVERFTGHEPVELGALARALGINVKSATLRAGISGEIRPDPTAQSRFTIRINRHENKARQRFTLAHEIAHFLLHKDLIRDGVTDDLLYRSGLSDSIEAAANRLAADIIMPWLSIERKLKSGKYQRTEEDAERLANDFGVSRVAMKIRLGLS